MKGFLLDTDIAIDLLKDRPRGRAALAALAPLPTFVSAATVGELVHGVTDSKGSERDRVRFEEFLATIGVLAFDEGVARIFGRLRHHLHSAGRRIDDPDLMIAATAIYHDLALVSGNTRHFERVKELRLESPY